MSKKIKPQKFTFKSFIRLIIFITLIYFSISWLSLQKKSDQNFDPTTYVDEENNPNFLSNLYQKLPENSRYQIEHFNQSGVYLFFQDKFNYVKQQLNGFPSRQIKEIQKAIIKNVSDDMIKNIENN